MTSSAEEVRLRALEPEDLELIYQIENDTTFWRHGASTVPYSRYALRQYLSAAQNDIYADGQVRLVIVNEQDETVGLADLVHFDPRHQRAETGIVILDAHRRQGYASAALVELERYALRVLHLHQLYAVVEEQNKAAYRLFCENGFQEQARLKDWLFDGRSYHDSYLLQRFL